MSVGCCNITCLEESWLFTLVNTDRSTGHLSPSPGCATESLLSPALPFAFHSVSLLFISSGNFLCVGTNSNMSIQCPLEQTFHSRGSRAVVILQKLNNTFQWWGTSLWVQPPFLTATRTSYLQMQAWLIIPFCSPFTGTDFGWCICFFFCIGTSKPLCPGSNYHIRF